MSEHDGRTCAKLARMALEMPCAGETYLSWNAVESGGFEWAAECNGGPGGDCGWYVDLLPEWGQGVTAADVQALDSRHMIWRKEQVA